MHKQRIWVLAFCAFGAIGALLPWAEMMLFAVTGLETTHGRIALGVFAAAAVIAGTGVRRAPLERQRAGALALLGLAAAGLGVWSFVAVERGQFDLGAELQRELGQVTGGGGVGGELGRGLAEILGGVAVGPGIHLVIAAGALLVAAAVLLLVRGRAR